MTAAYGAHFIGSNKLSIYKQDLPAKTIQKWRNFAADPAFITGIDWLRHVHAPKLTGGTPIEKFESAIAWHAYQKALSDIEDRLTALSADDRSIEEPPLNG